MPWLPVAQAADSSTTGSTVTEPMTTDQQHILVPSATMEEVVVTGTREGPRLWKVSRQGHVLWILGTLTPLPDKMKWESQVVEDVLRQSQLVLPQIEIKPNVSLFGLLPLYLQVRRTSRLPDDDRIEQWLSPELYQRFINLQSRYAPDDKTLLKLRPLAAAGQLYRKAITANGLKSGGEVQDAVLKLARKYHVKVQELTIRVDDPRGILKQADTISREAEVACLDATMVRLERDMGAMKRRASSWALGDLATFTHIDYPQQRGACWDALTSIPRVQAVSTQIVDEWYQAAVTALSEHESTLGLRSIDDLLAEDGVLERFRAAGYVVEQP